jgi:predicted MFS family arabinose efflux permease
MSKSAKFNAFYLLTLISVIYLFDYADRKVMSALFDAIKTDWQLSDSELGLLNGIVSLMISIFVLPLSVIVDRWSRKYMIAIMVFIWSIATLMCAFAQNYNQLLFFRALTGLGEAAYAAAAVYPVSLQPKSLFLAAALWQNMPYVQPLVWVHQYMYLTIIFIN